MQLSQLLILLQWHLLFLARLLPALTATMLLIYQSKQPIFLRQRPEPASLTPSTAIAMMKDLTTLTKHHGGPGASMRVFSDVSGPA